MNAEQLRETTMSAETRRVVAVRVAHDGEEQVRRVFAKLMGKTEAASRREWMEQNGNTVDVDV
jgi:topoisomerase-4 subunit B